MKLLAFTGSFALGIYIIGLVILSILNVSKMIFEHTDDDTRKRRFIARQFLIIIWPLACITREGRSTIKDIWNGDI